MYINNYGGSVGFMIVEPDIQFLNPYIATISPAYASGIDTYLLALTLKILLIFSGKLRVLLLILLLDSKIPE